MTKEMGQTLEYIGLLMAHGSTNDLPTAEKLACGAMSRILGNQMLIMAQLQAIGVAAQLASGQTIPTPDDSSLH